MTELTPEQIKVIGDALAKMGEKFKGWTLNMNEALVKLDKALREVQRHD